MTTDLTRAAGRDRTAAPDPAFAALPRLARLRDALTTAVRNRPPRRPDRWGEPPVFFFDPARQSEYEAARRSIPALPDRLADVAERIGSELPGLFASVEVRRAARAVAGLREAAAALAPELPAAKELAHLLAVPDDESVLVLDAADRTGYRLFVRGVADADQFQLLLLEALGEEGLLSDPPPARFAAACRDTDTVTPAGVPMVAEARFQFLRPSALRPDGTVPAGFRGSDHWVWGHQPLASVPRVDGERVLLVTEPAFRRAWEVERWFPAMAAELRLLDVLGPFQVTERLGRITGRPVPVRAPVPERVRPAKAA
jgi:hypothetical protein